MSAFFDLWIRMPSFQSLNFDLASSPTPAGSICLSRQLAARCNGTQTQQLNDVLRMAAPTAKTNKKQRRVERV